VSVVLTKRPAASSLPVSGFCKILLSKKKPRLF
jgi:hypothetical protein